MAYQRILVAIDLTDEAEEVVVVRTWTQTLGIPESTAHVKTGKPATEIKATADELLADLIVIGTYGQHGLGLLLGSIANGVLHGVACDVLRVRIH